MAKRFGRNQRRRARERIASLESSLQSASVDRIQLKSEVRDLRGQLEEVANYFGWNHASLRPREGFMRFGAGDPPESIRLARSISDQGVPLDQQMFRDFTARRLITSVKRDEHVGAFHFYVRMADESLAYCISDEAIKNMPTVRLIETLREEIGSQFASLLVRRLKEAES